MTNTKQIRVGDHVAFAGGTGTVREIPAENVYYVAIDDTRSSMQTGRDKRQVVPFSLDDLTRKAR